MGILDEAIKEHLELKRQHGADASELKQLEDEAFGAAERPGDEDASPDPLAEAPTQFMQRPEDLDAEAEPGRSPRTELAGLQEPPPASPPAEAEPEDLEEAPEPAEEESPAIEQEAVPEPAPERDPEPQSSHTTAEREAIAEHPTEMYDVEAELGPGEPAPSAEEEPPAEEPIEAGPVEEEEDPEDFFDEQRLSDELDQALEAPAEEDDLAEDEYDEEPEGEDDGEPAAEGGDEGPEAYQPAEGEEDVLEETPDFLEEAPEDDRLWFEQKPPKDFDFDD